MSISAIISKRKTKFFSLEEHDHSDFFGVITENRVDMGDNKK